MESLLFTSPEYTESGIPAKSKLSVNSDDGGRCGQVQVIMIPDTSAPFYLSYPQFHGTVETPVNHLPWHVTLTVFAEDLPALMRNGLHLLEANVEREKGFFEEGEKVFWFARSLGFKHVRVYHLVDRNEAPQWEATLEVYSLEIKELRNFQLSHLSADNVRWAKAWNANNNPVYMFDSILSDQNINAIYDDMPLEGLWPWPKQNEARDGKGVDTGAQSSQELAVTSRLVAMDETE